MTPFEKEIGEVARRWRSDARDIERGMRSLHTHSEKLAAQTHANAKAAAASELERIMHRCGVQRRPG